MSSFNTAHIRGQKPSVDLTSRLAPFLMSKSTKAASCAGLATRHFLLRATRGEIENINKQIDQIYEKALREDPLAAHTSTADKREVEMRQRKQALEQQRQALLQQKYAITE